MEGVSLFVLVWKGRVCLIKEALAGWLYGAFHCFAGQSKGGPVCGWQTQVLRHGTVTSPSMTGLSLSACHNFLWRKLFQLVLSWNVHRFVRTISFIFMRNKHLKKKWKFRICLGKKRMQSCSAWLDSFNLIAVCKGPHKNDCLVGNSCITALQEKADYKVYTRVLSLSVSYCLSLSPSVSV